MSSGLVVQAKLHTVTVAHVELHLLTTADKTGEVAREERWKAYKGIKSLNI